MRAIDYQTSFLGRISFRRNQVQVISMDVNHEQELQEIEQFQTRVADRFADLLSPPDDVSLSGEPLLSISWLRKLVNVFLCIEAEFKAVVVMTRDPSLICRPPLDRLIPELLERAVKALDICNSVSSGVDSVRQCLKFAEIAVSAFDQKPVGDGQVKRARKALISMLTAMTADDKEIGQYKGTERAWSFGRRGNSSAKERPNFRSFSMIVSKNWSASKQIQAMSSNLVAPRSGELTGLALPVYIMSSVMVFVMWALVAAVPCQERSGLLTNFQIPKHLVWAQSMIGLQEKIGEEWKRKEKKGSAGLLEEMQRMEKLGQSLVDFADGFELPGETEKMKEAIAQVAELSEICRKMEEGLVPLQMQIREIFHRIVRSRTEVLELIDQAGKASHQAII